MAQQQDPTISRIRDARHQLSEKFGHDPERIVAYYLQLQEEQERLCAKSCKEATDETKQGDGPTSA